MKRRFDRPCLGMKGPNTVREDRCQRAPFHTSKQKVFMGCPNTSSKGMTGGFRKTRAGWFFGDPCIGQLRSIYNWVVKSLSNK